MPNTAKDNPARPPSGTVLAALGDLAPGAAIVREYREGVSWYSVLIARDKGGAPQVYENICPHAGSPLERFDGHVIVDDKRFLICAMHGASFRIEDGECVGGPSMGECLTRLEIVMDGDLIRLA